MKIIKAIVLNDYPGKHYATWVKEQKKTIETRMRNTSYRGDLVICCGAKSVTANAGKALCIVELYEVRDMLDSDEAAACIENAPGRKAWMLRNWRFFKRDFSFSKRKVGGSFQWLLDDLRKAAEALSSHALPSKEVAPVTFEEATTHKDWDRIYDQLKNDEGYSTGSEEEADKLYDECVRRVSERIREERAWSQPGKEEAEKEAIAFLDSIRDYERENGQQICYDERTSKELYKIFKTNNL